MLKIGIIGGSGYTGGELIRLLVNHPKVEIDFVYSTTKAGKPVTETHLDLIDQSEIKFTDIINPKVDILFLCLGHGNSTKFLAKNTVSEDTRIIDLSNDFRLKENATYKGLDFIYGLPELNKEAIKQAKNIANPGCFATCIQLALLPLAASGELKDDIHINATTGSTGAGVIPSATTHFSWRSNNLSWYKPFTHQHLGEIEQSVDLLQPKKGTIHFLPNRGNFARGIFATAYTKYDGSITDAQTLFQDFYRDAVFTKMASQEVSLKQVVNTNYCHLHLLKHKNLLLMTSVIDNLLKGASGQAIQNMNLMFGFPENMGLQLKAMIY
ncbi:N-acetyl-gamma-glutamyl-phosphate reductase [Eudoraea chungangensis]|uniref:N-acetyl-gamma-glutamyl-phosphate reductase n=1 Tax=Eudoraea chungangensis TaxID=1481905 RepID=UPI0023EBAC57|nr:N-acetyl-gamma-glutamyl-phosphate reductase [Eudoraea chungangensis]